MSLPKEIFCVDPGLKTVDTQACGEISQIDPTIPFSHHLPGTKGMASILKREKEASLMGIVILGSVASVNSNEPWQRNLNPWILEKIKSGVPTLGICYGHQLIAKLFGGEIGFLHQDRKKFFGFRSFDIHKNCSLELPFSKVEVVASHEEVVTQLPSCLKVCASSKEVPIEGFQHESLPIVAFQTHPEAREDFCSERGISISGKKDPFSGGRSIMQSFISFLKERSF